MLNEHLDRCERICGQDKKQCFIQNYNQIKCIADMVVNKAMGVNGMLEMAARQDNLVKMHATINTAVTGLKDLMDWVKYLRVVQDLSELRVSCQAGGERRLDDRYSVPDLCRKHILMDVGYQTGVETVNIIDFSRRGIRFQGYKEAIPGAKINCRISTINGLAEASNFQVKVIHCHRVDGNFLVGAAITGVHDAGAFQVYRKLYDFIMNMVGTEDNVGKPETSP